MKKLTIPLLCLTLLLCACSAPAASPAAETAAPQPTAEAASVAAPEVISPLRHAPQASPAPAPEAAEIPAAEPVPAESAAPIPEATPEPIPATPAPTPGPPYELYTELVEKIRRGLTEGWSVEDINALDLSAVFQEPDYFQLGWVQTDINHDGVDELIFGVNNDDGTPGPAYDIFTILNGSLAHPAKGRVYSKWYLQGNGALVNETTNDGMDRWYTTYGFFNGMLVQTLQGVDRGDFVKFDFEDFVPKA